MDHKKDKCLILVVDDEVELEKYIEILLQRRGYKHVSFSDPKEALQFLSDHADSVGVIITDIKMPGIDGIELSKQAALLNNAISVILVSGYSDKLSEGASLPNVKAFLDKPVSRAELLKAVDQLADRLSC